MDAEVARLFREAEKRAINLLRDHHGQLSQLVDLLLDHETVDGCAVYQLLGIEAPTNRPGQARPPLALVRTDDPTAL